MDILAGLLGGVERVRIIRLFVFNADSSFSVEEISKRSEVSMRLLPTLLKGLESISLIKKVKIKILKTLKVRGKSKSHFIDKNGFTLNKRFFYLDALRVLVSSTNSGDEDLVKRFSKTGKIKLLLIAGVFIKAWDSRADLLIVGDELSRHKIDKAIHNLEAEIGKELNYSVMDTSEFEYRIGVYDKLIRDILDFPHKKLIDKIGLS